MVITTRLLRLLVSDGVDENRIHVIPPGVNPSLFEGPFEDPFSGVSKPRVLFVGRLVPQKGVDTLVSAAGLLEHPSAQVLLVGDGPERSKLEQEAKRIGVADRLHFVGFFAHDRLPAVLAHADLLRGRVEGAMRQADTPAGFYKPVSYIATEGPLRY